MRDFHQAVPTHAYIEELPANAGSDDWGAIDDELRPTAQAAVPVAVGKTGWPARPPPEESPPPSRPQSELRHSDVDALGFILGKLQEQSNALDAQAVRQESKLQLSREELRRLEERIRERLEREGRKPSRSEQKVLDRVRLVPTSRPSRTKRASPAGRMASAPERRPAPQVRLRHAARGVFQRVRQYGEGFPEGARLDDDD